MRSPVATDLARRDRQRRTAAATTLVAAAVALGSAALPPLRGRLADLIGVTSFAVPRTAAGLTALAGCALLVVARGLRRGSRLAWVLALVLLGSLVVLHLLKGIDVEESVVTGAVLALVATQRRAFPVLPSRAAAVRAVVLGVVGALAALAVSLASYVEARDRYRRQVRADPGARRPHLQGGPWWFDTHALRLADPVLPVIGIGLVCAVLWLALSPRRATPLHHEAHLRERERARAVVAAWGRDSLAYFALRDDKDWFFSGSSVVAHSVRGDVCLVSPDPIGPPEEADAVWEDFRAHAERGGWAVVVLGAAQEWLPRYEASGMRPVYLGDEAVLDTATFSLAGRSMRGLRQASNRVERAGITVTHCSPGEVDADLRAQLEAVSDASRRGEGERGFSMTLSRLADPADADVQLTVARTAAGRVAGYLQWVPAPGLAEGLAPGSAGWSLDVMRRSLDRDLPNGVIDHMIIQAAAHLAAQGGGRLALNFAVLRTLVAGELEGRWATLARQLVVRLGGSSQMESLWRFNAKFDPRWRPRYVVVDAVTQLATDGLAIARAEGLTGSITPGSLLTRVRPRALVPGITAAGRRALGGVRRPARP